MVDTLDALAERKAPRQTELSSLRDGLIEYFEEQGKMGDQLQRAASQTTTALKRTLIANFGLLEPDVRVNYYYQKKEDFVVGPMTIFMIKQAGDANQFLNRVKLEARRWNLEESGKKTRLNDVRFAAIKHFFLNLQ